MSNEINLKDIQIDFIKFHKMVFLFNALESGWTIKKKDNAYIFSKNHEGKKEVYLDSYLKRFMQQNLNLENLL
jgi:hypothetical protein